MLDDINDNDKSSNVAEQDTVNNPDNIDVGSPADEELQTDNVDELKEKLQKVQEVANKNFARMREAQGYKFDKATKTWIKPAVVVEQKTKIIDPPPQEPKSDDLSSRDTMALFNAKVTEESDIDEVRDYAKLKGISIGEALKTNVVKAILSDRAEERKTANATNTSRSRSSNVNATPESLLAKANKTGEIPEGEDLDRMLEARYTPKTKDS